METVKMEIKNDPGELLQNTNKRIHEMDKEAEIKKEMCDISSEMPQNDGKKIVHTSRRPWITEEFMQKVQQRDELHSRVKKNPGNSALKKQFSVCRNQTAALRRKLKRGYQMYLEDF